MNASDFTAATQGLIEARREAQRLRSLPAGWLPDDLNTAYRLQRAVARPLGEVRGWKVSALTAAQQKSMAVPCPVASPLLAPWVQTSAARFALSRFIAPLLEGEFAFELARDLPAREADAKPYTRSEVEAAIGSMHIGVEVCDSRLPSDPESPAPIYLQLADNFNNGAYAIGSAGFDWRDVDFANQSIVLRAVVDGQRVDLAEGTGRAVLDGDPVGAVALLANAQPPGYGGLRAGQFITTGSCTGAVAVPGACAVEADFGALGTVRLRFE
jgi:2-keto-4-pentenoate hydratase